MPVPRPEDAVAQAPRRERRHRGGDQVEALLVREARDRREQRDRGVALEAEGLQQRLLAPGLALRRGGAVAGGEERVGLGVPPLVVDAVENAVDHRGPLAQHAVQALAERGRADLLAVAGADRGDGVGVEQAPLEQVDPAVILDALGVKQVLRDAGVRHGGRGEDPLVREIVHREQRGRPRERPREVRPLPQVQRQQRGLPVVRVDHVGVLAEGLQGRRERRGRRARTARRCPSSRRRGCRRDGGGRRPRPRAPAGR